MKTYSSVEEMREEYARIRARLENPANAVEPVIVPSRRPAPIDEPEVWSEQVIEIEHKLEVNKTRIWWHEIIDVVEQETGISAFDFMSVRRHQPLLEARLLVYALAADCCPHLSLAAIGRLAHKDHTTIMHGAPKGRLHPAYQKLKTALLSRLEPPSVDEEGAEPPIDYIRPSSCSMRSSMASSIVKPTP